MKLNIEVTLTDDNIAELAKAIVFAINGAERHPESVGQTLIESGTPITNITSISVSPDEPTTRRNGALDSAGMPWDARIHATTHSKIANGEWRLRKGVDDATLNKVLTELKHVMGLPAPTAETTFTAEELTPVTPPAPPVAPVAPVVLDNNEKFMVGGQVYTRGQLIGGGWDESAVAALEKPAPVAPTPTPPAPPVAPVAPVVAVVHFPQLLEKVTKSIAAGTLTMDGANAAAAGLGLPSFVNIAARPDLIPALMQVLFK